MVTVANEISPLLVIEFLSRLVDMLKTYFKAVNADTIQNSVILVYQILDEMLDNGTPHTTEPNILHELIPPPSLMGKMLASVTGNTMQADNLPAGSLSNVPWRKSGVRYNTNEVFFDFVEEIDAIIDANGLVVSSEISGSIQCACKLSGMPDMLLTFHNPGLLDDVSLHPCVRYSKFNRDKQLSFIPPDGRFELAKYRVTGGGNANVPVSVRPSITFKGTSGDVNISITPKNLPASAKPIEDLVVSFSLPPNVSSTTLSGNCGQVVTDPVARTARWVIGKVPKDKMPSLTGSITLSTVDPAAPPTISDVSVEFTIMAYSVSGLRVNAISLVNEKYRCYKGVRPVTKAGRFTIRL